jgi:copper(I)-binding protein
MNRRHFLLAATLLTIASPAFAQSITIADAWARETPTATAPGVVYLTITDAGAPDRLTGVTTPLTSSASLHESKTVNGIMQMRPVSGLPVAPGQPAHLQPGGYHIMLEGLKKKLLAGDSFPLTLTFEHAGPVTTTVAVRSLRDKPSNSMGGMDMGTMKH